MLLFAACACCPEQMRDPSHIAAVLGRVIGRARHGSASHQINIALGSRPQRSPPDGYSRFKLGHFIFGQ
ncbi:hypothetical protein [Jannaschia formosa]|uniref:hypothetical protein n=1 Tax=Jannaschia formosa TaxID=2259592 RepID=UPI000E1B911D|nr:hypothetical protein [Jannaschia formosa]TFL17839.1 hypothetical protein DR046_13160 [Jannaschia formosa]